MGFFNDITNKLDIWNTQLAILEYYLGKMNSEDDLVFIIMSNLLCEFIINKIFEQKPEIQNQGVSFSNKIKTLYNEGMLYNELYSNLKKLILLRNSYAHSLHPIELDNYYGYNLNTKELELIDLTQIEDYKKYIEQLRMMCMITVVELGAHAIYKLKINIPFDELMPNCKSAINPKFDQT